MEVWEEGEYIYIYIVYTYRYTVTIRMTCIKMGSDESHFNVSLIVRDKVTRQLRSFRLPVYRLNTRSNWFSIEPSTTNSEFI